MQRILYVAPSAGIGGAETFLVQTAHCHRQYQPIYACLRPGPLVDQLKAGGAKVFVAPATPRMRSPLSSWRAVRWLAELAKSQSVNLIHSTMAYGALYGGPAALLAGIPHAWFQHGPVTGWQDWLAGRIPSRRIFVNSAYTAAAQASKGGASRIETIKLGVLEEHFEQSAPNELVIQFRRDLDFASAMICRPQPQKGIELWLEATANLGRRGFRAGAVLCGGERGSYISSLHSFADRLGVKFLWIPSGGLAWGKISGVDALVCASISPEGYGLTLAEGMARGIPVIAPREGGPLDLIRDGENGFFFDPRNAGSLADTLQFVHEAPAASNKVGNRAREHALLELRAEKSIAALEQCYERILEKP